MKKKDVIEIKGIGNGYLIIQRNSKEMIQRIVGKLKTKEGKILYLR